MWFKRDEINELFLLSQEELLFQLGEEISLSLGLFDSNKRNKLIKDANDWLESNRKIIQNAICNSYSIQYYLTDTNKFDKVITIASIADLISSIKFNISPVVVAVLVFKEGIKSYCGDFKYE